MTEPRASRSLLTRGSAPMPGCLRLHETTEYLDGLWFVFDPALG